MGSRGSFVDVDRGDFTFKEGGKQFTAIGTLKSNPNVKILVQNTKAVRAPEYSHTPNRIYAIVKDGQLKHLAFYGPDRKQKICIDFLHSHKNVQPHCHFDLKHNKSDPGIPPTAEQLQLIEQIRKEFKLHEKK